MLGRIVSGAVACALALACWGTAAQAAGPGETFLVGGLPLPAGAIAGGPSGTAGNEPTSSAVSQDGRYVAFTSDADTLAPGAEGDVTHVFRKDRVTGDVVLVSRATGVAGIVAAGYGASPTISDDGSRVAWVTPAQLTPADNDTMADVYVRDVATATTLLASPGTPTQQAGDADLSGDGQHVAFVTSEAIAPQDLNGDSDVYVRDLAGAATQLVSWRDGRGAAGNRPSFSPSISGDGRWVAYASRATDLLPAFSDRNGDFAPDVFVRDAVGGVQRLVSNRAGFDGVGGNRESTSPSVAGTPTASLNTVRVAYTSDATDVGDGDGSDAASTYLRAFPATRATLVSRADGALGANADQRAHLDAISDDGNRVVFSSDADNLGAPPATYYSVYVRDVAQGRTARASTGDGPNSYSVMGDVSGDGSTLTWMSELGATPDADPDLPGVYARSHPAGAPQLVSRPPGDAPFLAPAFYAEPVDSGDRGMSADGRYVVALTNTSRVTGRARTVAQIVRVDTATGAIEIVSRAPGAAGAPAVTFAYRASISADGNRIAFVTPDAFDPADGDDSPSVYVRDVAAATTTLASRADGPGGANADVEIDDAAISADGAHVAFVTSAGNLGVPGGTGRVWVRDLAAGATRLASRRTGDGGDAGQGDDPSISANGDVVAFLSSDRLDPADGDADADVYVRELATGATRLVSRRGGPAGLDGAGASDSPAISANGRVVAFRAPDQALAPEAGPWGGHRQIVARDLATEQNTLVSRAPGGPPANDWASEPNVDGDGSVVVFETDATNLLPGRGGEGRDAVFARDLATGALDGPPAFGRVDNEPTNGARSASVSDDGQCISFSARGHNAATGPAGDLETLYVHVLAGTCPKPLPPGPPSQDPPRQDPPGQNPPRQGPPGGNPPRAGGATAPRITGASLLRKRFRVARGATAQAAARGRGRARRRGRRTPAGSAFRFTLNTRANVTIAFERKASGRKVGRACRRPTRRLRRRRACTRWVAVRAGSLVRNGVDAGRQSVAFSGRIGRAALAPGAYRATLRASNAAGSSPVVRLAFAVVRR